MRILFINYSFPGIFAPLLAGLAHSGEHELYFVSSYSRQAWTMPGVRHIRLASGDARARSAGQELEKMLAAGRQALRSFRLLADNGCIPDLVLASVSGGYAFFWDQAFPSACRISWLDSWKMPHPEDSDMRLVRHLVQNRQLLTSDRVILLTAGQPSPLSGILTSCLELPCAVNTTFFAPGTPQAVSDMAALCGQQMLLLPLLSGHLALPDLDRGLLQLLQAVPQSALVLLCDSATTVTWIQERLAALAPQEAARIHVLGQVSLKKYCALLQLATALILPPGSTVPVTLLLEAMSCETPVLLADSPDVPDFFRHTATVLPEHESTAFFAGVSSCLQDHAELARRAGAGRCAVLERFAQHKVIRLYCETVLQAHANHVQQKTPAS